MFPLSIFTGICYWDASHVLGTLCVACGLTFAFPQKLINQVRPMKLGLKWPYCSARVRISHPEPKEHVQLNAAPFYSAKAKEPRKAWQLSLGREDSGQPGAELCDVSHLTPLQHGTHRWRHLFLGESSLYSLLFLLLWPNSWQAAIEGEGFNSLMGCSLSW